MGVVTQRLSACTTEGEIGMSELTSLLLKNAIVLLTMLLIPLHALAEDKGELRYAVTEVADHLYMLKGVDAVTGGNIVLSVGDDGVVMIDDGIPKALGVMQKAIKSITDKPVDFLINTHFHWDHAGNNGPMAAHGARIFAHEHARKRLHEELGKASDGALPVFTFSDEMHFHLNGNEAHIFHVKNAHTDGDVVIYFKNLNVMHTGDVYINGYFPYIDLDSGGSITGIIAAHQKILTLVDDKTKIIPGHGELASRQDVENAVVMLQQVKKIIETLKAQGKSEDEVVALAPLAEYQAWRSDFITLEKMTRQVYQSLMHESK